MTHAPQVFAARALRKLAAAPWLIAVPLAVAWLIVNPPSADLAGALYRTRLFEQAGFTLWDNQWYGGIYTLNYSVLFPPLGALLGTRLLGALAVVAERPAMIGAADAVVGRDADGEGGAAVRAGLGDQAEAALRRAA